MAYVLMSGLRRTGAESDRTGRGAGFHDPHEAAENRRADPSDRAEGLGFDGVQLSLAGSLPAGLDEPALLKDPIFQSTGLKQHFNSDLQTRGAAERCLPSECAEPEKLSWLFLCRSYGSLTH